MGFPWLLLISGWIVGAGYTAGTAVSVLLYLPYARLWSSCTICGRRLEWLARRLALGGGLSRREAISAIEEGAVRVRRETPGSRSDHYDSINHNYL